jgi:hypothetical protein
MRHLHAQGLLRRICHLSLASLLISACANGDAGTGAATGGNGAEGGSTGTGGSSSGTGGTGTGGSVGTGGSGTGGSATGGNGSGGVTGTGGVDGTGGAMGGTTGKGGATGTGGVAGARGTGTGGATGAAGAMGGATGAGGAAGAKGTGTGGAGGATGTGGAVGGTGGAAAGTGPCDIFAAGSVPCVAAHSTVRALYGAYNGNLYQVTRASDNTTKDIGVLSAGGFANSATQDTFCAGTTCTISILYDQSGKANHLTRAPAGQRKNTPDNLAVATALKLTVSGHPVYGVHIPAGTGYRIDKTSGIATGDQPETEYMVTSGSYYNSGCCFDYGNAETNNNDDGAATMEALYFGTKSDQGKGAGAGPWVMVDMENGIFAGVSFAANPNCPPQTSAYVTGLAIGRSGSFALKGGNAQSGTLATFYDGNRPKGYNPMKKQGAIILGMGGDNTNDAEGNFFEGVMTAGASSDATDNAVQANIVAAGYGK